MAAESTRYCVQVMIATSMIKFKYEQKHFLTSCVHIGGVSAACTVLLQCKSLQFKSCILFYEKKKENTAVSMHYEKLRNLKKKKEC